MRPDATAERLGDRRLAARRVAGDADHARQPRAPGEALGEREQLVSARGALGRGDAGQLGGAQKVDLRAHERAHRAQEREQPVAARIAARGAIAAHERTSQLVVAARDVHHQEREVIRHVGDPQRRVELDAVDRLDRRARAGRARRAGRRGRRGRGRRRGAARARARSRRARRGRSARGRRRRTAGGRERWRASPRRRRAGCGRPRRARRSAWKRATARRPRPRSRGCSSREPRRERRALVVAAHLVLDGAGRARASELARRRHDRDHAEVDARARSAG